MVSKYMSPSWIPRKMLFWTYSETVSTPQNIGLNNTFVLPRKSVLTYLALKVVLYDTMDRTVEKWAQSASFINVLACRAVASTLQTPSRNEYAFKRWKEIRRNWKIQNENRSPFLFPSFNFTIFRRIRKGWRNGEKLEIQFSLSPSTSLLFM